MRLPYFFLFSCLSVSGLFGAEHYPYVATVVAMEAVVRSGPDTAFYATSTLRAGDRVEVYYETEDWCAIRPPLGSFSWISARYIDLGTNNIGTVAAEGLASRVGSDWTELCETVQVKLKKGEKVLVLGRLETPENAASPLWLKIAPPSGEYRWVPSYALDGLRTPEPPKPERLVPNAGRTARNLNAASQDARREVVQVVYENDIDTGPSMSPPTRPTRSVQRHASAVKKPSPVLELPKVEIVPDHIVSDRVISESKEPELPPLTERLASARPDLNPVKQPERSSDPFQIAFEELKTETRIVLTRPTEDWVFETLIQRGNELYEIAPSDKDLEKVYHLLETLQRTRAVRQEIAMKRQFKTGGLLAPPPSATPLLAGSAANSNIGYASNRSTSANPASSQIVTASAPMERPVAAKTNAGFDVVGKLGEFDPLPKGHPPYAVVDENEQILCLVSPATGVDLRKHVGQVVGISGILGRFEKPGKANARHITAQTVGVIE